MARLSTIIRQDPKTPALDPKNRTEHKPGKSYRAIYEALKEEIMLWQIKPGDSLPEVEIAQRFGSSRAPVREALIHLFKEGFLRSADYKGYSVPDISMQELKELFQVRLLVEPPAAELAALNPATFMEYLPNLEGFVAQQTQPVTAENLKNQLEAEIGFHTLVARASGNSVLAGIVGEVAERLQRYHVWLLKLNPSLRETVRWHRQILAEIRTGHPEGARKAMTEHIEAARTIWLERYFR
jgi:DNA-binding GntR family transcriptional regulator